MDTDRLIERLTSDAAPVPPLPRPGVRATMWLAGATVYLSVLAWSMTSSADLAANGTGWKFLLPQLASIATGAAAAVAAFVSTIPGYSRRILWAPAAAALLWVGSLAVWSLQEWGQGVSLAVPREWLCVAMIAGGGALPALFMTSMLRRGAPLSPALTSALAALAAAGLANVGACLSHPHSSSSVVLLWHGLTILALAACAALASRHLLNWQRLRRLAVCVLVILTGAAALLGAQTTPPVPERIDLSRRGPQVGERVPDFTLNDQNGRSQTLQSIMGPRGAMLVFQRSADW